MAKKFYFVISPVLLAVSVYIWNLAREAVGIFSPVFAYFFVVPILVINLILTILGISLIVQANRRKEKILGIIIATVLVVSALFVSITTLSSLNK